MVVAIDQYMVMRERCVMSDNLSATTLQEKENIMST